MRQDLLHVELDTNHILRDLHTLLAYLNNNSILSQKETPPPIPFCNQTISLLSVSVPVSVFGVPFFLKPSAQWLPHRHAFARSARLAIKTMAETVIRKACDRCHAQKLSCKRYNDEPCERCIRLKTECKSSPSLRYRKAQLQQQFVENWHQHSSSEPPPTGIRSPKRRRTDSEGDPSLVPPDAGTCPLLDLLLSPAARLPPSLSAARTETLMSLIMFGHRLTPLPKAVQIVSHTGSLASENHLAVTPGPDAVLDIGNFNLTFDHLGFFTHGQPEQHLSHPTLPGIVDNRLHHHPPAPAAFVDSWDHQFSSSAVDAYPSLAPVLAVPVAPESLPPAKAQHTAHHPDAVPPEEPLGSRGCVPEHSSSDKRSRPRTKQRPRQITLTHRGDIAPLYTEAPSIHWMAQLSDINARLLDLASALPSSQKMTCNGPSLSRPVDERFRSQGFPIDEMFKLTRKVADILDKPPPDDSDGKKSRHANIDASDPGNSMLILSTYVRLLDMYQRVFDLVHTELSQVNGGAAFLFWKLPDVTVGSFAVESSPFLQMSLTIQLAEEFLSRLRGSTVRWSGAGSANSTSMFVGVVDVSYKAFKSREDALAKHLTELRSEIEVLLDS